MSTIKEQTNNSDHVDWIEKVIEKNYITHFNYDEFTNKQEFENNVSSIEKIFRTNWNIIQNNLLINITDSDDIEKIIDKLIDHLIKLHDEFGYGFAGYYSLKIRGLHHRRPHFVQIPSWCEGDVKSLSIARFFVDFQLPKNIPL
ncbi:13045_t:CDS:2 [Rhizophagus irregularis]|nr:13045_t:CDS:2 [Rhizophagus irregularis]